MQDYEILVHISAPTTNQQDDFYRSLTSAYKDFTPHTSHGPRNQENNQLSASLLGSSSAQHDTSHVQVPVTPFPQKPNNVRVIDFSTSKDSYGSFPSDISTGCRPTSHVSASQGSPIIGPSRSRLAQLEKIQEKWKEGREKTGQRTPIVSSSSAANGLRSSPLEPGDDDTTTVEDTFIEDTQAAARAMVSQIESVYEFQDGSTQEDTDEEDAGTRGEGVYLGGEVDGARDYAAAQTLHMVSALGHTHAVPFHLSSSQDQMSVGVSSQHSELAQPEVEGDAISTTCQKKKSNAPAKSSTSSQQHSSQAQRHFDATSSTHEFSPDNVVGNTAPDDIPATLDFTHLPTEVYPPPPAISTLCPGQLPSQITPFLATIKTQNPKRFKPSKQQYILAHDDRGYWSINCSSWQPSLQARFWTALSEKMGSGNLGWGVSLHRIGGSQTVLGESRVYCWAEVLEHVWLVIWLCSEGKVGGQRMEWRDAGGVSVVQM